MYFIATDMTPSASKNRAASAYDDPRTLVRDRVPEPLGGILHSEGVSAPAATFGGLAAFVLPIFLSKERNIDSPDCHQLARLRTLGLVHSVAPDNVPAGMIVVGL